MADPIDRADPRSGSRHCWDRRTAFDLNGDFASYVSCGAMCLMLGLPLNEVPQVIAAVNEGVAREDDRAGLSPRRATARSAR